MIFEVSSFKSFLEEQQVTEANNLRMKQYEKLSESNERKTSYLENKSNNLREKWRKSQVVEV